MTTSRKFRLGKRFLTHAGTALLCLCLATGGAIAAIPPQGPPPGVVVARSPDPAKIHVASPSIIRSSDGNLLISHDWSGRSGALTSVYRSADAGKTWERLADVPKVMWATLFEHDNALYLIGTSAGIGDAVIRRSTNGGHHWTTAADGHSGVIARKNYHCGPVPVLVAKGRIWRAFEHREDPDEPRGFTAYVFSAPLGCDLLEATNWTRSDGVKWEPDWLQVRTREWIEGNVVASPDGEILNILRTNTHPKEGGPLEMEDAPPGLKRYEVVAAMHVSDDGRHLRFDPHRDFRSMPGAQSKFTIRHDKKSGRYFAVVSKITAPEIKSYDWALSPHHQRNVLKLISSPDLKTWTENYTLLSYRKGDAVTKANPIGFQYADWIIDGDDMLVAVRTAWTGAPNYHDSNYITFHRITDFRGKKPEDSPPDLAAP